MAGRHFVLLAALLVKPHPAPALLHAVIFDPHSDSSANASKSVDHQPDQRPVAQTGQGIGVDGIEQHPSCPLTQSTANFISD